jgi:acyl-CoA dehydrogenase
MRAFVQSALRPHAEEWEWAGEFPNHVFKQLAGRDVTYTALRRYLTGEGATREVTIAKLATQRTACQVIDRCLQIHPDADDVGVPGIESALRDARLGPMGGGTDEIMKEILGRSLGL